MPTPRGSQVLSDWLDDHEESLQGLIRCAEQIARRVPEGERTALLRSCDRARKTFDPLPGAAAEIDNVMRLIGAAAGAGAVTRHVTRLAREAGEDRRSLQRIRA